MAQIISGLARSARTGARHLHQNTHASTTTICATKRSISRRAPRYFKNTQEPDYYIFGDYVPTEIARRPVEKLAARAFDLSQKHNPSHHEIKEEFHCRGVLAQRSLESSDEEAVSEHTRRRYDLAMHGFWGDKSKVFRFDVTPVLESQYVFSSKFGFANLHDCVALVAKDEQGTIFSGIHIHVKTDVSPYVEALRQTGITKMQFQMFGARTEDGEININKAISVFDELTKSGVQVNIVSADLLSQKQHAGLVIEDRNITADYPITAYNCKYQKTFDGVITTKSDLMPAIDASNGLPPLPITPKHYNELLKYADIIEDKTGGCTYQQVSEPDIKALNYNRFQPYVLPAAYYVEEVRLGIFLLAQKMTDWKFSGQIEKQLHETTFYITPGDESRQAELSTTLASSIAEKLLNPTKGQSKS